MKKAKVLFVSQDITPYLDETFVGKIARKLPQGIQERGKELAEAAGVKFSMSNGFVQRFRKRNETIIQKNEIIKNFNDLKKYAAQSKFENLTSNMLSTINKLEKLIYNESKEMVQNTLEKH
jgi:hypothetical protein